MFFFMGSGTSRLLRIEIEPQEQYPAVNKNRGLSLAKWRYRISLPCFFSGWLFSVEIFSFDNSQARKLGADIVDNMDRFAGLVRIHGKITYLGR